MPNLINKYTATFKGLSREVWWLALITLVNRTGAMVIPFLSLYLTEDKQFTVPQVGWVMTSFGLGSFFGAWLGGQRAWHLFLRNMSKPSQECVLLFSY